MISDRIQFDLISHDVRSNWIRSDIMRYQTELDPLWYHVMSDRTGSDLTLPIRSDVMRHQHVYMGGSPGRERSLPPPGGPQPRSGGGRAAPHGRTAAPSSAGAATISAGDGRGQTAAAKRSLERVRRGDRSSRRSSGVAAWRAREVEGIRSRGAAKCFDG